MSNRKFFTFPHCGTDIFLLSVFTIAFSSYRMLLHQFFPLIPTCNQYYITFFGTTMCIGFYFVRKKIFTLTEKISKHIFHPKKWQTPHRKLFSEDLLISTSIFHFCWNYINLQKAFQNKNLIYPKTFQVLLNPI